LLLQTATGLTFQNSMSCPHSAFVCSLWLSDKRLIISLCSNYLLLQPNGCVFSVQYEANISIQLRLILEQFCFFEMYIMPKAAAGPLFPEPVPLAH